MATGAARGKGPIRANCPLAVISNLAQSSDLKWFHLPLKDLEICTDLFVLRRFRLHQCVPSPTTLAVGNGPSSCQALTKSKLLGPFRDSSMHMHMKIPHLGYVSRYDQPMKYTAWPETSNTSKRYVIYRVSEQKPTSPDCPRHFKDVMKTPHALQISWFLFVRTYFPSNWTWVSKCGPIIFALYAWWVLSNSVSIPVLTALKEVLLVVRTPR